MRRNREEVSATEEIALTERDAPLTEEERNLEGFVWAEFVDSNKRDFAESLGWDIGKQLGCGVFGCVYESSGPWVVKITRDPSEGPAWAFIDDLFADPELSHLMGGFCRVKEVARLRPDVIVARQRGRAVVVEATPEDESSNVAPVYAIQRESAAPVFEYDDRYPSVVFLGARTVEELFLSKEDLMWLSTDPEREFAHGFPENMLPMSMVWDLLSVGALDPDRQLRVTDLTVLKVAVTDFWRAASSYYDISVKIAVEWDPLMVSELQADLKRLAIEIRKLTAAMSERPNGSENMFGYVLGTTLWAAFEDADFLPSDLHMFNIGWREHARIGESTLPLTVVVTDPGKAVTPFRPDIREVDLKQMLRRNGLDIDAHLNGVRANQPGSYWCTLCGEQTDRMTSCRRCEEELWEWAMKHTQRHMRANARAAMVPARVRSRELYKYDPLLMERDLGTGAIIPESVAEMIEKRRLTDPGLPADPEERGEMRGKGYRFDPATGEPLHPNAKKRRGPIYTAIMLDEPSKDILLGWWEDNVGPLHEKVYAHHMTVQFGPSEEDVAATPIGEPGTLRVVGIAADEKGQAVLVEPSYPSTNPMPHVTVAVAEGVKPVYSNELLKRGYEEVDGPLLTGTIVGQ